MSFSMFFIPASVLPCLPPPLFFGISFITFALIIPTDTRRHTSEKGLLRVVVERSEREGGLAGGTVAKRIELIFSRPV